MDSSFIPFNKFIKNEVATLERIANNPIFKRDFLRLYSDAKEYLVRIAKPLKNNSLTKFNFQSVIEGLIINGKDGAAHFGGLIKSKQGTYDQLTYYFALCDNMKIIRKFHFDYAPKHLNSRMRHPIFHIQYPGEISHYLLGLNLKHDHLESGLSEPRIPFSPMSLALIINLILNEFPNERNYKVSQDKTWRDLIKSNEINLLAPYFKDCHTFFNRSSGCLFTSDFCYGEE